MTNKPKFGQHQWHVLKDMYNEGYLLPEWWRSPTRLATHWKNASEALVERGFAERVIVDLSIRVNYSVGGVTALDEDYEIRGFETYRLTDAGRAAVEERSESTHE